MGHRLIIRAGQFAFDNLIGLRWCHHGEWEDSGRLGWKEFKTRGIKAEDRSWMGERLKSRRLTGTVFATCWGGGGSGISGASRVSCTKQSFPLVDSTVKLCKCPTRSKVVCTQSKTLFTFGVFVCNAED